MTERSYTKLSVLVPAYNEEATIVASLKRVVAVDLPLEREILVIDDGSRDRTAELVESMGEATVRLISQPKNMGKGAAIRRGIEVAAGDLIVVHDADLEYDPEDWRAMLDRMERGDAMAVYGSRFTGQRRNMRFSNWAGNRFLSIVTGLLYRTSISDMETCYKMVDAACLKRLHLTADKFDIEPEITSKLLRSGVRIVEVPISYTGRDFEEGKKISWKDGIPALWTLLKMRVVPRSQVSR